MKRKVKKYADGDLVEKEGKGFFGETQKWKEDKEGRKFTDSGNRYYSADDVKGKLSGLFGGKKDEDEPKKSTTMPSGYEKLDVSEKTTPSGKTYLREEADIDYKSEKKAAPAPRKSKIEAAAPAPQKAKASMDSGIPKDTKSTRMPSGYDKLDVSEKKSMGKDATPMGRTRAGTAVKSSNEPKAEDVAAANEKFVAKMKKQGEENEARKERIKSMFSSKSPNRSYKSGGSVKSASARADGCAIRGKTRA